MKIAQKIRIEESRLEREGSCAVASEADDEIKDLSGWINVVEHGVKNDYLPEDKTADVSDEVQGLIKRAKKHSVLYFPAGRYPFKKGITLSEQMTIQGDSYMQSNVPRDGAGTTDFVCEGVTEDVAIITLTEDKFCIKNICFYSDSCKRMDENPKPNPGEEPRLHHRVDCAENQVSAILCDGETNGLGFYENLFISGFSGTGLHLPYLATANHIIVFTCGLGIDMRKDTMLSNSEVWGCQTGMHIDTGATISNVRVEEIVGVGVNNIGFGQNKITNLTVDQCGYCGFQFGTMIESYIIGKITRCGQFYFNTEYKDFKELTNKVDNAFSLLYGNYLSNCQIQLSNTNMDNWNDKGTMEHQVYVIRAIQTKNTILTCNVEEGDLDANFVVEAAGDLELRNGRNAYKYYNGHLCDINGINVSQVDNGELLKVEKGSLYVRETKGAFKPYYKKMFAAEMGCVVMTAYKDEARVGYEYGGFWKQIGCQALDGKTIYYYQKLTNVPKERSN